MAMLLRTRSRKLALLVRIVLLISVTLIFFVVNSLPASQDPIGLKVTGRRLLSLKGENETNCTPPAINEFPSDGFTRAQRKNGWVILHTLLACYCFILLAKVCDDFFVPAIKKFCDQLRMTEDVAGATFMAIASSSPELFINSVGTFITEGDIGVGTIVGSAVFNILAVPACCGLFANMALHLEWWPITRDSIMYGISVIMLINVIFDGRVEYYEAVMLVSAYFFYIFVILFSRQINNSINRGLRFWKRKRSMYREIMSETHPLLGPTKKFPGDIEQNGLLDSELTLKDCEEFDESTEVWKWPSEGTKMEKIWWVSTWPISFVLFLTIPDCKKFPRLYVLTFLMCMLWIGSTSYITAWLITVIGDTLNIPDSVMGLTFLAAGTSVPEAVSSVIVTNQGHGAMGLSSSIGSNTFDILLCLGLPWLIKTRKADILIKSAGIAYSAFSLFSTIILLYFSLVFNKFILDWKIGLSCLLMYMIFLVFASLIELNVFGQVNFPTC